MVDKIFLSREYEEVHSWMDAPYRHLKKRHRILRHSPIEVIAKYGFTDKALAGLLHIGLDFAVSSAKKEVRRKRRKPRK